MILYLKGIFAKKYRNGVKNMDTFIEQIVPIKKSPKELLLVAGIIVLGVLLIILCGLGYVAHIIGMFSFLLALVAFGIVYAMWYFISQLNLEYEYIITNGDLDVDKIIAKRSRKRFMSVNCRDISEFGKYDPDKFGNRTFSQRIVAATVDENAFYAVFSPKDEGEALLIFSPNEKTLNSMKKFAPRVITVDNHRS